MDKNIYHTNIVSNNKFKNYLIDKLLNEQKQDISQSENLPSVTTTKSSTIYIFLYIFKKKKEEE